MQFSVLNKISLSEKQSFSNTPGTLFVIIFLKRFGMHVQIIRNNSILILGQMSTTIGQTKPLYIVS